MRAPHVRAVALVSCALWALACQSTPPSAPEEPAGPNAGLGLSVATCDGLPATHVLTPGGPGTNGNWFFGTGDKDVIVGTAGDDKIDGGSGADRICLLGGNDEARGGAGKDRIFGDAGNDVVNGGNENDYLDGGADDDQLGGGKGADELLGGTGEDVLEGGAQADQLAGGNDNNTLYGNNGADFLAGENGADALDGGGGGDTCAGGGQAGDTTTACELALFHLVAGGGQTCALTPAGAAYCWGTDANGQLGDGTAGGTSATPGAVTGGHIFASLTAGDGHTCGVRSDGAAYCWGNDASGQLGDGSVGGGNVATPGAVTGGHTWASLDAGAIHTCGVRTDGAAYCWGADAFGQLGDGTVGPTTATPGAVTGGHTFASLAVGVFHTCGVRTDGAAYCWGQDDNGQLGDGTATPDNPTPGAVTGGHTFASLAAGALHTCGVRPDGAAYCWGWDDYGQLGDGTLGTPGNNPAPLAVTGGHTWTSLAAGSYQTCGVRPDGAAYCWGHDEYGQLGDGTVDTPLYNPTPLAVTGGHSWIGLAAGSFHTCGVRPDGAAYCWGWDGLGQLGDGTVGPDSATPGAVIGLP